ncbi:MAG: ATP-binding protein [Bacteroidota bacterium]
MRKKLSLKNLSRFTRGKVVTAFFIAGIAIVFSWIISRAIFSDIEASVHTFSQPNERLMIVNRLLEKVSRLDQLQRIQAIKNPQAAKSFLKETQQIRLTLDTLAGIYEGNEVISSQIDSMQFILVNRDRVYVDYVSLRANQQNNPELSKQLQNITSLVKQNVRLRDSTVVTTQNTVTTLARPKKKEDQSFWKRLFGKRERQEPEQFVSEEKNITIDTISVAKQNSIVKNIDDAITRMKKDETVRNNAMLLQELDLVNNGNSLINELWNLLHKIQKDELAKIRENSSSAIDYFNSSINRAGIVLMLFFLVIAALVYAVLTDLTKSNAYRVQLQAAKEEAEHISVMKQRFLSNMSHEIRTPLQSIIGFSEQVKTQSNPEPRMLDAINASAEHLLHIVNEILDYSRIISGKFVLENRVFNFSKLIDEVAANMRLQAENKTLSFTLINNISAPQNFTGDDFRIKQVLYNLLGNAIKFTSSGGIVLRVDELQTGQYSIKVTDSGTGISKENMTRIFNEFEQTDESITRQFGGTGLGLSISKSLIETMGGRIEADSELGIGTTFSIVFPLTKTDQQPAGYFSTSTAKKTYRSLKTIVVDDDPFILSLCDAILSKHGIEHTCYTSAEALLNTERDKDIKLIFTDMRLPGKSGAELMKELKVGTNEARFVVLTAQVLPEEKARLIEDGFDAILSKPFREHELLSFYEQTNNGVKDEEAEDHHIDLSLLKRMTMNDQELMSSHLSLFAEQTAKDLTLLKTNVIQNHQKEVYEIIHKLAGRTGQVGATELMMKLRELEQSLKEPGRLSVLKEQLDHAVSETDQIVNEIRKMLN